MANQHSKGAIMANQQCEGSNDNISKYVHMYQLTHEGSNDEK
jgi:hypothetical protein